MVYLLIFLLGVQAQAQPPANPVTRLDSIVIDPGTDKMTVVVTPGEMVGQNFTSTSEPVRYEIDLKDAIMTVNGEKKRFEQYEGVLMQRNLSVLTLYALDCIEWWRKIHKPVSNNAANGAKVAYVP